MAGGENHAKEQLVSELENMATHLDNGRDISVNDVGRGLAVLIRMFKPVYLETFVTEKDLEKRLTDYRKTCPLHMEFLRRGKFSWALGPFRYTGGLSLAWCGFLLFLFFIGKGNGWW